MKIKYSATDYSARIVLTAPAWQLGKVKRMVAKIDPSMPLVVDYSLHWSCLGMVCTITGLNKYVLRAYKHLMGKC